jgi:predicted metal-dependent enzyme (double-stranded beta helix superfamily)
MLLGATMKDKQRFIEQCQNCMRESDSRAAIYELLCEAISDPASVMRALGEPQRAGIDVLLQADDLTILNVIWGPGMNIYPHNHNMWATIGIYSGCEDNTFYQRENDTLVRHGMKQLKVGDVAQLGAKAIHSVKNPLNSLTSALHIYGGDFFSEPRSQWDAQTLEESPYSVDQTMAEFEKSNHILDEAAARG